MIFQPYTFTRSPARVEADASQPEVLCSSPARRPRARRLYSLVAVAGFVTYGFGLPRRDLGVARMSMGPHTFLAFEVPHGFGRDGRVLEADDEVTAARLGAEILDEENACGDTEDVTHVFVVPFDNRRAYLTRIDVEPAPLNCCGGNAPGYVDSSPHWATCSERPEGTGQPREEVAA